LGKLIMPLRRRRLGRNREAQEKVSPVFPGFIGARRAKTAGNSQTVDFLLLLFEKVVLQ
jgi:hypothetical protein